MKTQITIAHFKSLYCLYVLPSVDNNHNYSSKIWVWSKVSTTKHLCKKLVILKKVLSAAICWKKSVWKSVDGSARISNFQFVDGYPLAVANARREFPLVLASTLCLQTNVWSKVHQRILEMSSLRRFTHSVSHSKTITFFKSDAL